MSDTDEAMGKGLTRRLRADVSADATGVARRRKSFDCRSPHRGDCGVADRDDPAAVPLLGYTDRLSVAPGETVRFCVSCTEPEYQVALVRLVHGDPNPDGPGFK